MKKKEVLIRIIILFKSIGINFIDIIKAVPNIFYYIKTYIYFIISRQKYKAKIPNLPKFGLPYVTLGDHLKKAGEASGHYFHQDLIVASEIFETKPKIHLDIGSRVDGFITHLLSFKQKTIIGDIRELDYKNKYLSFSRINLTETNNKIINKSYKRKYESISCLHVIEHMGLGRYGDDIDPLGFIVAIKNLSGLLLKGGNLYLSHPVGETRIEFNGHYVFSIDYIYPILKKYDLYFEKIHLIDDLGNYVLKTNSYKLAKLKSRNYKYGCVIWFLKKK